MLAATGRDPEPPVGRARAPCLCSLQEVLAAVRAGQVDVLVALRLDHLFSSLKELHATIQDLGTHGADLVVLDDGIDTTSVTGRAFFDVVSTLARFEHGLRSARSRSGLDHARDAGRRLGRPVPEVDLAEAERLRAEGMSLREIARKVRGSVQGRSVAVSAIWPLAAACWASRKPRRPFRDRLPRLRRSDGRATDARAVSCPLVHVLSPRARRR